MLETETQKTEPVKRPAGSTRKKKIRLRLWEKDRKCRWCGMKLTFEKATLDHLIPKSKGGKGGENLVIACHRCNQKKDDQVWTMNYKELKIAKREHRRDLLRAAGVFRANGQVWTPKLEEDLV